AVVRREAVARLAGAAHDHPEAPLPSDEAALAQLAVSAGDGVPVHVEVRGQHPAARQAVAVVQLAELDHVGDLLDDLAEDRDPGAVIEANRLHVLTSTHCSPEWRQRTHGVATSSQSLSARGTAFRRLTV